MIKKTGVTFLATLVLIFSGGCSQENSSPQSKSSSDVKAILVEEQEHTVVKFPLNLKWLRNFLIKV